MIIPKSTEAFVGWFKLPQENGPDITFKGRVLGHVSDTHKFWEGENWFTLTVFLSDSGKLICHRIQHIKSLVKRSTVFCGTACQVITYFGNSPLAKELYRQCGFDIFATGRSIDESHQHLSKYIDANQTANPTFRRLPSD